MSNKLLLDPEDIIVPAEINIGNLRKLEEYFDVFNRGIYEHVPPVLVVSKKSNTRQELINQIIITQYNREMAFKRDPSKNASPRDIFYNLPYLSSTISFGAEEAISRVNKDFLELEKKVGNARFYLLDGNHRAIAATLNHEPIFALEIEDNPDLRKIRKMAEECNYPELYRKEKTIDDLKKAFEYHCLRRMDKIFSVKRRVGELVVTGGLPETMIRRYLWELGVAV